MTPLPFAALALLSAAPAVRPPTPEELRGPGPARQPSAAVAPVDGGAPGFHLVSGSLERVDWDAKRITLATLSGTERLSFDRNSLVYLEEREGTLLDLKPGQRVRASLTPDGRVYWLEVARPAAQGSPGGGGAARPDGGSEAADGGPPATPPPAAPPPPTPR